MSPALNRAGPWHDVKRRSQPLDLPGLELFFRGVAPNISGIDHQQSRTLGAAVGLGSCAGGLIVAYKGVEVGEG